MNAPAPMFEFAFRARENAALDVAAQRTRRRRRIDMMQTVQNELVSSLQSLVHRADERTIGGNRRAKVIVGNDE